MPREKDWAEEQTDILVETLEDRIRREYNTAFKEAKKKYLEYSAQFEKDDAEMKAKLDAGEITEAQYKAWRSDEMLIGKRWEKMKDTLAEDLTMIDQKVMSMTNGYMPEAYSMNFNYAVFETEKGSHVDTSFTLYSRETVERLLRDDPNLLPKRKLDIPKDRIWNKRHINSAITQGVLQGKSLPQIAENLRQVTDMDRRAAIRNARTMMTGAQNSGRLDAYKRAENLGIKVMKQWMATLDHHTRDSHAKLDGEKVKLNEKFSNGLMFPGDPDGKNPAEIYNCRCTMVADLEEYPDTGMKRLDNITGKPIENITYAEWAGWKERPKSFEFVGLNKVVSFLNGNKATEYFRGRTYESKIGIGKNAIIRTGIEDLPDKPATKWKQKLTEDQEYCISDYTGDNFMPINNFLRGIWTEKEAKEKMRYSDFTLKKTISNIDAGIKKFDLKDNIKVYRTCEREFINQLNVGSIFEDKGFGSTSCVPIPVASGDVFFEIDVPKGKGRGAYVDAISWKQGEEFEFLLKRNTKYYIESIEEKKDGIYVKATVID